MINFVIDLLFVPNLRSVKFNLWLYGIISIISVFMLIACIHFYGEVNLIGKMFKGIIYISLVLFMFACIAYIQIKENADSTQ